MKYVLYAVLAVFLVPLQVIVLDKISIWGIHPDVALIAVCLIGLQAGELEAIALGIVLGFSQDVFSGAPYWENLWLKPVVGLLAALASRNVVNLSMPFSLALLLTLSIFSGSVMFLVKTLQGPGVDFFAAARGIILPQACYDALLGMVCLRLLQLFAWSRPQMTAIGYE
jgi:rod shape-determining protein MreD